MPLTEFRILPRQAITDVLQQAINSRKLVALTAPMGYGKTTAARELVRQTDCRTYFTTVNAGRHNTFYLWDRVCSQLRAQGSELAASLQTMGFPANPSELHRIMELVRVYCMKRRTLLIMDDYHYMESPAMNKLIEDATRDDLPGFSLLLLSRTMPGIPLDELCLKGLAQVFDKNLLAFSREDARSFFSMHGIDNKEIVDSSLTYSEGWAAALWLSLRSFQTHGTLAPDRSVDSLLESVVFSQYADDEKRLLLYLAPLSAFSARQATALTDDPATTRKLIALHQKNAFLNYDPATDMYTLHSLFRSFLLSILKAGVTPISASIDKAQLYRRIGRWHAEENDDLQAIRAFATAGTDEDYLAILKLFEKPGDGLTLIFDPEGVRAICEAIPWRVRFQCPIGYLAFLYHYLSRVNLTEGLELLREAEERFAEEVGIPPATMRRIKGEILLIRGIQAFNDLFAMRDIHKDAHELLDGRSSISHRRLIWTFSCPHAVFLYLREPGSYQRIVDLVENNLHYYQDMADGCSMGAQEIFRAEWFLERGQLKKVSPLLMKAVYRASGKDQMATVIAANFTMARLLLAQSEGHKAMELLNELTLKFAKGSNPLLMQSLDVGKGYVNACLGRYDAIPQWLREGNVMEGRRFQQGKSFSRIVYAKALLLKKDWLLLETVAQDTPSDIGHVQLFTKLHAKILEAVALYHLDGLETGLVPMQEALELARPDNITLSIAEYGRHIMPLLRHLRTAAPKDVFLRGIHRLAQRYYRLRDTARADEEATIHILSSREQLLLQLAAQGKGNSDIAAHLGVSLAAVKKAFTGIYRKMGVSGRVEAVRRIVPDERKQE